MIRRLTLCLVLLLAHAVPVAAWDPYEDDSWSEDPAPPPAEEATVPPGVYYVTEVYVADVVTVSGPVTTYSTATIADTPGTYARVAETVGTGVSSQFDGTAFNGRASLDDGRPVAGTYYENFIIVDGSFVPVSVVFFQDDVALTVSAVPTSAPMSAPTSAPMSAPTPAPLLTPPLPTQTPVATPGPLLRPAPTPERDPETVARIAPVSEPSTPAPPRRIPVLRPGVASSPLGDIAFSLEVLRGRPIALWFGAAVDGARVPASSWRVISGEHTALGPGSGSGDEPFRARWDLVTRPGGSWNLRVEATIVFDGVPYLAAGDVAVVVRSPALIR